MKIEDNHVNKFMYFVLSVERKSLDENPNPDPQERRAVERRIDKKLREIADEWMEDKKHEN